MNHEVKLEKWQFRDYGKEFGWRLTGVVYGHPRIPNGSWITTSKLVYMDFLNRKAQTQNTTYILGENSDA